MSLSAYLVGWVLTGAIVGALSYGATGVRARFLPSFTGPLGVLASVVLCVGAAVIVGECLGVVGLFDRWSVAGVLVIGGWSIGWWSRRHTLPPSSTDLQQPERPVARADVIVALTMAGLVVAQWCAHLVASYRGGMWDGDTMWYHLPFATHFVQTGFTTHVLYTNGDALVTFFPANSELMSALTILPFGRDVLLPSLNVAWLLLAMLAGWCIGRRYGAASVGLIAVAVVASFPVMATTQAGTARNDVMGLALLLSAAAIVVHSSWDRASIAVGALAAGLTVGVKLSVVVPAVLLVLATLAVMPRGRRRALAPTWLVTFGLTGSFWYLRNLALVGNPVPFLDLRAGPLDLRSALTIPIANTAVMDRVGDPGSWASIFEPGLRSALGPLWSLVLLGVVAAVAVVVVAGRDARTRLLGVVAVGSAVSYVLQPNGAPGSGPLVVATFALNLRYVVPVIAIALLALAATRPLGQLRARIAVVALLTAVVVANQFARSLQHGSTWEWITSTSDARLGLTLVGAVLSVVLFARAMRRRVRVLVITGSALALVIVAAGYWGQRAYLEHRYAEARPGLRSSATFAWAHQIRDARIALAGDFFQYPLEGPALSNVVRFAGVEGAHGSFRRPQTCREWRQFLAVGHFQFVVLAPTPLQLDAGLAREERWTTEIPGATPAFRRGMTAVYRLRETIDPNGCS